MPPDDDSEAVLVASIPAVMSVARRASILTRGLTASEPKRAHCTDCRGKGFDLTREPGKRSSRKCPRCQGAGSFAVGSTKR